jgi:hypothetical protein
VDLVDLSHADGDVDALLVHLGDDSYQGRVAVEASDDLHDWRSLGSVQLLKVARGGDALVQERIALDGMGSRYLRLEWLDDVPSIASIDVETRPRDARAVEAAAVPRQWRDAVRVRAGDTPGEYRFDTDGPYPVDRLRIDLPQPNTVARATVQSRAMRSRRGATSPMRCCSGCNATAASNATRRSRSRRIPTGLGASSSTCATAGSAAVSRPWRSAGIRPR